MDKKFCVYTVLFGDYEELNEQPVQEDSEFDFICFSDNKKIRSNTWKIIYSEPVLQSDIKRSSRFPKIIPHRYLQDYDLSLYIDNSIRLKKSPEIIFSDLFKDNYDMALFSHSYRDTVLDEFAEVARLGYDSLDLINEQFHSYESYCPHVLKQHPFNGGFIIRKHNKPSIIRAMDDWLIQVLRYSRRDQLSINYILDKHDIKNLRIHLDIRENPYLQWPVCTRYGSPQIPPSKNSCLLNNRCNELINCQQKLVAINSQLSDLQKQIVHLNQSKSWRITRPLRKIMKILRGNRNDF